MDEPDLSPEAAREALERAMQEHSGESDVLSMYAERNDRHQWTGAIVVVRGPREAGVPIADHLAIPSHVTIERGRTRIEVDASGDHPRYVVSFETRSPTVLKRLHLQALVEEALASVTTTTKPTPIAGNSAASERHLRRVAGSDWVELTRAINEEINAKFPEQIPAGTLVHATFEAKEFVRRRSSQREIDQAAHQAANVYPTGGIEAVRQALLCSERQAWRYVRRAQELKLIKRKRAPRKRRAS